MAVSRRTQHLDIQGSLCLALTQASLWLCLYYSPFLALLHSSLFYPPGVVSAVLLFPQWAWRTSVGCCSGELCPMRDPANLCSNLVLLFTHVKCTSVLTSSKSIAVKTEYLPLAMLTASDEDPWSLVLTGRRMNSC